MDGLAQIRDCELSPQCEYLTRVTELVVCQLQKLERLMDLQLRLRFRFCRRLANLPVQFLRSL